MKKLFAVYLESLDQDLNVYTDEREALQRLEKLQAEGKPAKMEKFESYQAVRFGKPTAVPPRIRVFGKRSSMTTDVIG